jgi:hypothetical protein
VSTCRHCGAAVVSLTTTTGRVRAFATETAPYATVAPGDGYLVRNDRIAVPTTDVPPRVLRGNPRVAVAHRCREYVDWKVGQTYGLGPAVETLKSAFETRFGSPESGNPI